MKEFMAEKHCKCCKKLFLVPDCTAWAYKSFCVPYKGAYDYYCSWSCMQKSRDTKRGAKKRAQIQRELQGDVLED